MTMSTSTTPARAAYEKVVKYMDTQVISLTEVQYDEFLDEMLAELEAREQTRKEEEAEAPE